METVIVQGPLLSRCTFTYLYRLSSTVETGLIRGSVSKTVAANYSAFHTNRHTPTYRQTDRGRERDGGRGRETNTRERESSDDSR